MSDIGFVQQLEEIIRGRLEAGDDASYTARLAAQGTRRMAQKVGEEGVEVALASVTGSDDELLGEAADLVYHLLVLLNARGLSLTDVGRTLEKRHSGS
jgi:phosphoribosyl-ATP pyrophosphohydrolase/phosphoribosyl-AMP cyclohydrolase